MLRFFRRRPNREDGSSSTVSPTSTLLLCERSREAAKRAYRDLDPERKHPEVLQSVLEDLSRLETVSLRASVGTIPDQKLRS